MFVCSFFLTNWTFLVFLCKLVGSFAWFYFIFFALYNYFFMCFVRSLFCLFVRLVCLLLSEGGGVVDGVVGCTVTEAELPAVMEL